MLVKGCDSWSVQAVERWWVTVAPPTPTLDSLSSVSVTVPRCWSQFSLRLNWWKRALFCEKGEQEQWMNVFLPFGKPQLLTTCFKRASQFLFLIWNPPIQPQRNRRGVASANARGGGQSEQWQTSVKDSRAKSPSDYSLPHAAEYLVMTDSPRFFWEPQYPPCFGIKQPWVGLILCCRTVTFLRETGTLSTSRKLVPETHFTFSPSSWLGNTFILATTPLSGLKMRNFFF